MRISLRVDSPRVDSPDDDVHNIALEESGVIQDPEVELTMWLNLDRSSENTILPAEECPTWQWGAGRKGAILVVNDDDDDASHVPDCHDGSVNSGVDFSDLQPLVLSMKWVVGSSKTPTTAPAGWTVTLRVDRPACIRIFGSRAPDAQEIVGPTTGPSHGLSAAEVVQCWSRLTYLMEGVKYPDATFDGVVTITLEVARASRDPISVSTQVRVAPWMMVHHGAPAKTVYVADTGDSNREFREALRGFVEGAGATLVEKGIPKSTTLRSGRDLIEAALEPFDSSEPTIDAADDFVRVLEHDDNAGKCLRVACILLRKRGGDAGTPRFTHEFTYDSDSATWTGIDAIAERCTQTSRGARMTPRELLAFKVGGRTNQQLLEDGEATIFLPDYFWVDVPDAAEIAFIAHRQSPELRIYQLLAIRHSDGRTNADLLFRGGNVSIALPGPRMYDPWMQDCMEIGYAHGPSRTADVVMRAKRERYLRQVPEGLLGENFGLQAAFPTNEANTFDSNGNLECTPPVPGYPWGRIYYGPGRKGQVFDKDVKAFLEAQLVQKPIALDTSWLTVGHVDEMLTFVPVANATSGDRFPFKLVIASPRLAYKILTDNRRGESGARMLFREAKTLQYGGREIAFTDIEIFLTEGVTFEANDEADEEEAVAAGKSAAVLKRANDVVQGKLDAVKSKLTGELGLEDGDVLEVPVLFWPGPEPSAERLAAGHSQEFDALTAGTVNMLVVNKTCIVPKPFGPIVRGRDLFETALESQLTPLGLSVRWIDDWDSYHVQQGEVHCGTNTLREPPLARWWEFTP